jgi:hypothetical protein
MKTVLNIIVILLVAAVIAAGLSLVVNNTSIASGPDRAGGQPPAMSDTGTTAQRPARPDDGGEGGVSLGSGLLQVLVTLAKLTGVTMLVLAIQKIVGLSLKRRPQVV